MFLDPRLSQKTTEFSERRRSALRVGRVELAGLWSPVRNLRSPRACEVPVLRRGRHRAVDVEEWDFCCRRRIAQHPPFPCVSSRQIPVAGTDDRLHQLVHAHPFRRLPCWNADRYERDALPPHAVVARSARGHSAERGTLRQRYGFDLISFASAAAGNGEVGGTNALTPLTNIR